MVPIECKLKVNYFWLAATILFCLFIFSLSLCFYFIDSDPLTSLLPLFSTLLFLILIYYQLIFNISHYYKFNEEGVELFNNKKEIFTFTPYSDFEGYTTKYEQGTNILTIATNQGLYELEENKYTSFNELEIFLQNRFQKLKDFKDLDRRICYEHPLPTQNKFGIYFWTFWGLVLYFGYWGFHMRYESIENKIVKTGVIEKIEIIYRKKVPKNVEISLLNEPNSVYINKDKKVMEFAKETIRNEGNVSKKQFKVQFEVSESEIKWIKTYPQIGMLERKLSGRNRFNAYRVKIEN